MNIVAEHLSRTQTVDLDREAMLYLLLFYKTCCSSNKIYLTKYIYIIYIFNQSINKTDSLMIVKFMLLPFVYYALAAFYVLCNCYILYINV